MKKAQPGDRIIITNAKLQDFFGKVYPVVACRMLSLSDEIENYVWIAHEYCDNFSVRHGDYKIASATRSFSEPPKETSLFISPDAYEEMRKWVNDDKVKKIAATIGQISDSGICPDCKGTGRIKLLVSIVDCDCTKKTKQDATGKCSVCKLQGGVV
jgi:hypothetical protein